MHRHLAVVTLAILSTACTIVVQAEPADDDGNESTSTTSSFPEQAQSSSSTGELEESDSSSTGREIGSSSGEAEVDDETSTGVDTTGEVEGSTSEIGETSSESTDASTDTGDLSTTGDDTTGLATCTLDSDCQSGNCIGGGFNDTPRCSVSCSPGSASDCFDLGSPGLCTWGGGDAHWCTGVFDFDAQDLRLATPDPDVEFLFYQNSGFLPIAADRHAYLVPPQQVAFFVELASINDPGYGPVIVDVHTSDGSLIGTFEQGDNPTIEPKGIHHYHWLIVRPAEDKKVSYQLWLKELCWPNC